MIFISVLQSQHSEMWHIKISRWIEYDYYLNSLIWWCWDNSEPSWHDKATLLQYCCIVDVTLLQHYCNIAATYWQCCMKYCRDVAGKLHIMYYLIFSWTLNEDFQIHDTILRLQWIWIQMYLQWIWIQMYNEYFWTFLRKLFRFNLFNNKWVTRIFSIFVCFGLS